MLPIPHALALQMLTYIPDELQLDHFLDIYIALPWGSIKERE